jgi:prepilin-type N-terminal cleavage/methylation domain-containing protein
MTLLNAERTAMKKEEAGFSMIELLVAMGILVVVVGAAMGVLQRLVNSQQTIWNRTEMHAGVRSATELLQQEVGQAGRVTPLTSDLTLGAAVGIGAQTVAVTSPAGTDPVAGMFPTEKVTVGYDTTQETVALTAIDTANKTITANFVNAHAAGVPVRAAGGFSAGIIPTTVVSGSTGFVLKMFGDINSDGDMLYVEYTCDTANGLLYRNAMSWPFGAKPANNPSMVLLRNVTANPLNAACFTYQTQTVTILGTPTPFVTDVAITLTVETELVDPITKQKQKETKALLNVSPRNIFNVWELASIGLFDRVQPTPTTVTALLP